MSFDFTFPNSSDSESESESENELEVVSLQDMYDDIEALWVWIRIIARHLFPGGLGSTSLTV
jgi:hypothetical protein